MVTTERLAQRVERGLISIARLERRIKELQLRLAEEKRALQPIQAQLNRNTLTPFTDEEKRALRG